MSSISPTTSDSGESTLSKFQDLEDHRWVYDVQDVSIPSHNKVYVVRFDTPHLPSFVLNNPEYAVREVWVDTAPNRLQKLLAGNQDRARRLGWGRTAIGCLIEVETE